MDSPEFLYVQPRTEAIGRRTMGLSVPTANEFTVHARALVPGCRVRVSRVLDGETLGLDEPRARELPTARAHADYAVEVNADDLPRGVELLDPT